LKNRPDSVFSPAALAAVLTGALEVPPGSRLMVAYSGGVDSRVLLHALCALRESHGFVVHAVHVDHGLQDSSDAWARHCEAVCRALDVPLTVERIDVLHRERDGLEAAARRARYACFARHLAAESVLLTAHHRDDQAETLLLQLVRGAGLPGLASMFAVAPFACTRLVRPLLGFSRAQLLAYAKEAVLEWIEDTSNADERLARNYMRHRILPALERRWPAVATTLARTARHAADASMLLEEMGAADLAPAVTNGGTELAVGPLQRLSAARLGNALRCWLRSHGASAPSEKQLRELVGIVLAAPDTRHALVGWSDTCVERYREHLHFRRGQTPVTGWEPCAWDLRAALEIDAAGWRLRALPRSGEGVALARLEGRSITVRPRRGGETCELVRRRHHHKLKKLLQEAGVPPSERARLPLLYADEELVAVADRWICAPFAAQGDEPSIVLRLEPL
jgi:tRNA(Ile)-lysidine synthase